MQRKHTFFFIQTLSSLCILFLVLLSAPVKASIVITGTRVIYSQGERSVSVKLNNNGKSPVLIQSWIDDGVMGKSPDTSTAPFIVTPPINRVDPGKGQTLQISFTGKQLPSDKESVFWLNVLEVPARNSAKKDDNFFTNRFSYPDKTFLSAAGASGEIH
ncbi:fimbrial biogenesis chaperone [Enterobacter hormaechei]|uniref:fimbrial biogenesis chaperone n=1 Tax=Enterobacter hormaechei TaxID=158836 RepID=UPI0040340891